MEKSIRDIIHLYFGHTCSITWQENFEMEEDGIHIIDGFIIQYIGHAEEAKPILRKLSSMTEEEEREMVATQDDVRLEGYPEILLKADSGETFLYMLSKGFDLFGLCESGLAIDRETLKENSK